MNGHELRRQKKIQTIKNSALKLFNKSGIAKTSVDEIASLAGVSKVTIFKYFGSKEHLISHLLSDLYDQIIKDTEAIVYGDLDFEKKLAMIVSERQMSLKDYQPIFLEEMFLRTETESYKKYMKRTKALMYNFFEEGQAKGIINKNISVETMYLYFQVYKSGLHQMTHNNPGLLNDEKLIEDLVNLYFNGLK